MYKKKTIEHVAIIMDGNGRWATNKGLKRSAGHKAGIKNCTHIITNLDKLDFKINNISLYVFSTENWKRPVSEINYLLRLIENYYVNFKNVANEENLKINHLGSSKNLTLRLKKIIKDIVEITSRNNGTSINLAFNYGGRTEIIDAINKNRSAKITNKVLSKNLYIPNLPDPDLIIRTGGEMRLSNFLLWQSAYAELYFTNILWPNFKIKSLNRILFKYLSRIRKYGR
jgi:undecaprenyl diphosphate synthase